MKFNRLVCIVVVLVSGVFACYVVWRQHVKSVLERLHPPDAEQVRTWAGLSDKTHLTVFTNIPDEVWYGDESVILGKFKWVRAYEDCKGSNYDCFVIAAYEPGALFSTNRAKFVNQIEEMDARIKTIKLSNQPAFRKEEMEVTGEIGSAKTPNGQKSYGFIITGFSPARFAFHSTFDVLAYELIEPSSYDERHPPADLTEMPTLPFDEFFSKVDAFLSDQ